MRQTRANFGIGTLAINCLVDHVAAAQTFVYADFRQRPEPRHDALDFAIYAPTGFFLSYQAWRKNVSGIVKGPLPFFWNVNKASA